MLASLSQSKTVFATPNYESQLEDQQEELEDHKEDYEEAQNKVQEIQVEIELLDVEIEQTLIDIDDTEEKIAQLELQIQEAEENIDTAEKEIEDEKAMYNDRMVAMYISGGTSYLEILMGAESLSDLFSRVQTIKTLSELDEEIINDLREKQSKIEAQKLELIEENNKLIDYKDVVIQKKESLVADKDKQQELIDEAKEEASKYASIVTEDQEEIAKTKSLIEAARETTPTYDPSRGATSISTNSIVAYASNFLGTPYVWGGNGPNYFDCSGFTRYVFAHFGVSIPRVSRDQAKVGTYVAKSDLQPGDLVFFAKPGRAVHHVGIYVGNNSYIHAPSTGDVVKISTLSSRSDYYTARRVY
jgi:cell wall-associated NlpC family hydrolase